jgi:hypothetical protein
MHDYRLPDRLSSKMSEYNYHGSNSAKAGKLSSGPKPPASQFISVSALPFGLTNTPEVTCLFTRGSWSLRLKCKLGRNQKDKELTILTTRRLKSAATSQPVNCVLWPFKLPTDLILT